MSNAAEAGLEAAVWEILGRIADPEIPGISLVDLGVIRRVDAGADGVLVELMPTFLGCPAIDLMQAAIREHVGTLAPVRVELVRDEAWTTERISPIGRERLRAAGFAPPPPGPFDLMLTPVAECPYCGSRRTALESSFGPTPCRAIYYCSACRQPFEQFKAV